MANYLDTREMTWFREPPLFTEKENELVIETQPHTSFHALAYDMTNAFGKITKPMQSFSFTVKVSFSFAREEDECGILIKKDNLHWAKAGVEYRNGNLDLSTTLYQNGYGDHSCREIGGGIQWIYFRVIYWNGNVRVQYSFQGEKFSDMRWFHIAGSQDEVVAGIYACSPGNGYYDCTFSDMQLIEM